LILEGFYLTISAMFKEKFYFDVVDSTNTVAVACPMYSVVCAEKQTAGRGRLGRKWISEKGNLFMSVVLPADEKMTFYGLMASVAVAKTFRKYQPTLKWPNDVLIDGKKICGILSEKHDDKLILGIGINVLKAPKSREILYPVTALSEYTNETEKENVMNQILNFLEEEIRSFEKAGVEHLRKEWLSFAPMVGQKIEVHTPTETIVGFFETISSSGELVLNTENKQRYISAGDVFLKRINNE
jgi:BirA family biotin operon repressor/biotin-[acetyl-CoA-carboxylase] ligase